MKLRVPALAPIACLFSLFLPSSASAAVLRVRPDGAGDGSSWATALGSVKAALSAAQAGDEIWVAAGTYKPAVAADALKVTVPVSLFGGFAGTETARDQRNPTANATVLDGAKLDTVLTITGASGTVVDGFTIRNGNGNAVSGFGPKGGGVQVGAPGTTISHNVIQDNVAGSWSYPDPFDPPNGYTYAYGAGISCGGSDSVIQGNTISGNTADVNSTVFADARGGGIYLNGSRMLVERNVFTANSVSAIGYRYYTSHGQTWSEPAASASGGAIYAEGSAVIRNNVLAGNPQSAIAAVGPVSSTDKLVIANNTAYGNGMAISFYGPGDFANNLISGNAFGASLHSVTSSHNCVYGNANGNYSSDNSAVGQNTDINVDPKLSGPDVLPGSPCIDRGDDAYVAAGDVDMAGSPRIQGVHVDIGAYEHVGGPATALRFAASPVIGTVGIPFTSQTIIWITDATGLPRPGYSGSVTLSLKPGSGRADATLSGTTTVAAVEGIATYTGLGINKPGTGFVLRASAEGLPSADSYAFPIIGAATKLAFVNQPTQVIAGHTMAGQITVQAVDDDGTLYPLTAGAVSLSLKAGTGTAGARLSGALNATLSSGVATFSNLSVDLPGAGYEMTASAAGLASGDSAPFDVIRYTTLQVVTSPVRSAPGAPLYPQPAVRCVVSGAAYNGPVTVSLKAGSGPTGATLSGTKTITAVNGLAAFSDLSIDVEGSGYVLHFVAEGGLEVDSQPLAISSVYSITNLVRALGIAAGLTAVQEGDIALLDVETTVHPNVIDILDAVTLARSLAAG